MATCFCCLSGSISPALGEMLQCHSQFWPLLVICNESRHSEWPIQCCYCCASEHKERSWAFSSEPSTHLFNLPCCCCCCWLTFQLLLLCFTAPTVVAHNLSTPRSKVERESTPASITISISRSRDQATLSYERPINLSSREQFMGKIWLGFSAGDCPMLVSCRNRSIEILNFLICPKTPP